MTLSILRVHRFLCILGEMPVQILWLPFILMGFYLFAQLSALLLKVPQSLGWSGPVLQPPTQRGPQLGPDWRQGAAPGGVPEPLLPSQESQEQGLRQRLLDEQFAVLRRTAAEAERILQDAVGKLDDPLHLRCTSSPGRAALAGAQAASFPPCLAGWCSPRPGEARLHPSALPPVLADYLVSRAQAALDAVSALEKGHAQYLASRSGECRGQDWAGRGHWWSSAGSVGCDFLLPCAPPCPPESQTWVWFLLGCFLAS